MRLGPIPNWELEWKRIRWIQTSIMTQTKTAKSHYSEYEAAAAVGLSIEQLRSLIRNHITGREEPGDESTATSFQPSDLVLFRILVRQQRAAAGVSSPVH